MHFASRPWFRVREGFKVLRRRVSDPVLSQKVGLRVDVQEVLWLRRAPRRRHQGEVQAYKCNLSEERLQVVDL